MKALTHLLLVITCLILSYKNADALFRTDLFRSNPTNRLYVEDYSFFLKDAKPSQFKLSSNQRALLVNIATYAIRKLNSYNFTNYLDSKSNSTIQSMQAISKELNLSTKTVGSLAVMSLVGYGSLASLAPNLTDEIGKNLSKEEKDSLQNLLINCLITMSDSLMRTVENTVDGFPTFPRLNAQECIKRSICEAHSHPKKYGLVGLFLQLFFPTYVDNRNEATITSKYQLAAKYGRENKNCAEQYDDCVISFLDVTRKLGTFFY